MGIDPNSEAMVHLRRISEQRSCDLRVEALRAASRLVAAEGPGKMSKPVAATLETAGKFLKWLEGEAL